MSPCSKQIRPCVQPDRPDNVDNVLASKVRVRTEGFTHGPIYGLIQDWIWSDVDYL